MNIDESTLTFGADQGLIGVLTRPIGDQQRPRIGCLLLNVGVNHRIGPRRINVKAARALAQQNIPSLRFDLSGVGDSRATTSRNDFRQQALLDMQAAVDQLQAQTGIDRFIVVGICSGAISGLQLSLNDPRVVGLFMFDSYIFLTTQVRLMRKLRRMVAFPFNPSVRKSFDAWNDWVAWARAPLDAQARRKAWDRIARRVAPRNTEDTGLLTTNSAELDARGFAEAVARLLDRGVDMFLAYSASLIAVDRDRDLLQGLRQEAWVSQVRYRHFPDVDHTATTLAAQRKLLEAICGWAGEISAAQPLPAEPPHSPPPPEQIVRRPATNTLDALERRLAARA